MMIGDLRVRAARASDAASIVDCNARLARETESLELDHMKLAAGVQAALSDPHKAFYFVAEIDGHLAGQLMITHEWSDWRNGDIWWIQSVYIRPEFRRRGVFRALYEHAKSAAQRSGAIGLRLYVEQSNAAAQESYRKLGMTPARYFVMEEIF